MFINISIIIYVSAAVNPYKNNYCHHYHYQHSHHPHHQHHHHHLHQQHHHFYPYHPHLSSPLLSPPSFVIITPSPPYYDNTFPSKTSSTLKVLRAFGDSIDCLFSMASISNTLVLFLLLLFVIRIIFSLSCFIIIVIIIFIIYISICYIIDYNVIMSNVKIYIFITIFYYFNNLSYCFFQIDIFNGGINENLANTVVKMSL